MENSAVEWLVEQLKMLDRNSPIYGVIQDGLIQQAKEMEANVATEYAEFCIRCDRANLKQVKFEDWKKSWDETFKSK